MAPKAEMEITSDVKTSTIKNSIEKKVRKKSHGKTLKKVPYLKMSAVKKSIERKARKKSRGETFKTYIYKVLKLIHPDLCMSSEALSIMNSFVNDIFERLARETSKLSRHNKKITITWWEIQCAVRLAVPGELRRHAVSEGSKAVRRFFS
eukprot:TRINITY_DN4881_c0_g3_i1.p1 TRINITY_DN4881_c0_g3~~TRINITY_DN4881_c0_g3_i1.p1  ORF type:complete len:170 (-),score=14.64 TRINITY_DN4881_c0_g3_i1:92-541(-)